MINKQEVMGFDHEFGIVMESEWDGNIMDFGIGRFIEMFYPLVMTKSLLLKMGPCIVDLAIKRKMSIRSYVSLPETNPYCVDVTKQKRNE